MPCSVPHSRRPAFRTRRTICARRAGLTLLELLLVVFILAMLALGATALTNNLDEQFRFDETKRRLETLRTAIAGDRSRNANQQPVVSGFVADIGRLPASLEELFAPGSLPRWQFVPRIDFGGQVHEIGLHAGWRGPYINSPPTRTGLPSYPDGWGNYPNRSNFGWQVQYERTGTHPNEISVRVQSLGADGAPGTAAGANLEYAADYPPNGLYLVDSYDHQIDLQGWSVQVRFRAGAEFDPNTLPDGLVRLRIYYPIDGRFDWVAGPWPESANRNNQTYLSRSLDLKQAEFAEGEYLATFRFENESNYVDPQTGVVIQSKPIPWGTHSLAVVFDSNGTQVRNDLNDPQVITLLPRTHLPQLTLDWKLE